MRKKNLKLKLIIKDVSKKTQNVKFLFIGTKNFKFKD